jgi:hypothetical protein
LLRTYGTRHKAEFPEKNDWCKDRFLHRKWNLRFYEIPSGGEFMQKFNFSIRTRDGMPIARLIILGKDQEEAERKLKQMYLHCEIISCKSIQQEIVKQVQKYLYKDITPYFSKQEKIST